MTRNKKNIPMYAACILLCLVLITTYMTSGLYARYTAEGLGSDSARVATFDITNSDLRFSEKMRIDIAPAEDEVKEIAINNKSEVVVKYTLKVVNQTNNIPLQFKISPDGGSTFTDMIALKDQEGKPTGEVISEGNLVPGASAVLKIKIVWDKQGAEQYMGMVDLVKIELKAEQID